MQVEIVDNTTVRMASTVSSLVERSTETRIAVAFVSQGGLALLEKPIAAALTAGKFIEFLVGLDMAVTEPKALKKMHQWTLDYEELGLYCYAKLTDTGIYHPKVYLFTSATDATAIVGSSNLTAGGLSRNVEVNAIMTSLSGDPVIEAVHESYNKLKFNPKRVAPNAELIEMYSEIFQRQRERAKAEIISPAELDLRRTFEQKANTLQHPVATRRDLVGWLEMVYDALPGEEFTNQQVYVHKERFRRAYPENKNVEAKIRQKLQELAAMGLIEHMGTGKWRKIT